VRQGADPDFIIRYPDGTHAAIAMSSTNYAHDAMDKPSKAPSQLLDLQGLRQAAHLIEHFRQQAGSTTVDTSSDISSATRYDKAP
jgi:hypothetical protein